MKALCPREQLRATGGREALGEDPPDERVAKAEGLACVGEQTRLDEPVSCSRESSEASTRRASSDGQNGWSSNEATVSSR